MTDFHCKISLIGNEFTGKTSLIVRYFNGIFEPGYKATFGAEFVDKIFTSKDIPELDDGENFTITVWDMAGQAHFKRMAQLYLDGSLGVIIVFDVNNPESFEALDSWLDIREKVCPESELVVVGNKNDLQVKVDKKAIYELEKRLGSKIIFTSAKDGVYVDEMFASIAGRLVSRYKTSE